MFVARNYLGLVKDFYCEYLLGFCFADFVDGSEGSFGNEADDLEAVFELSVANLKLGKEEKLSACNRPKRFHS